MGAKKSKMREFQSGNGAEGFKLKGYDFSECPDWKISTTKVTWNEEKQEPESHPIEVQDRPLSLEWCPHISGVIMMSEGEKLLPAPEVDGDRMFLSFRAEKLECIGFTNKYKPQLEVYLFNLLTKEVFSCGLPRQSNSTASRQDMLFNPIFTDVLEMDVSWDDQDFMLYRMYLTTRADVCPAYAQVSVNDLLAWRDRKEKDIYLEMMHPSDQDWDIIFKNFGSCFVISRDISKRWSEEEGRLVDVVYEVLDEKH